MVGWAVRGEGPLSLILSCTCKICTMYKMCWQRSMSFNSLCTPVGSTLASCVCVSSLGSDSRDQNNMWTSHDTDHHQNKRAPTTSLPYLHHKSWGVLRAAPGLLCVFASPSNTTMANALVSDCITLGCCWAQLALWAAVEAKREPTRTTELCIQIKGKLKAPPKLCYLFLCVCESE